MLGCPRNPACPGRVFRLARQRVARLEVLVVATVIAFFEHLAKELAQIVRTLGLIGTALAENGTELVKCFGGHAVGALHHALPSLAIAAQKAGRQGAGRRRHGGASPAQREGGENLSERGGRAG